MNSTLSELHQKVQKVIIENPRTREYSIDVFEQNGVITLKGNVPSREESEAVEDLVAGVFGVRGVINQLEIYTVNETRGR